MSKPCPFCGIPGTPTGLEILDAGLEFAGRRTRLVNIRNIVIHHSANSNSRWGVRECHHWHVTGNRWNGIGYNYFIEQSGRIYYGRSTAEREYAGAHARGWNSRSIGICLDGDYQSQTPTAGNLEILARLTAALLRRHGLDDQAVLYHRDVGSTTCPGRNFPPLGDFRRMIAALL